MSFSGDRNDREAWPTGTSQSLYALSEDEIVDKAKRSLWHALSIGRVVAFVGSGVSMSYGKASWSALFRGVADWVVAQTGVRREPIDNILRARNSAEQYPLLFELSERQYEHRTPSAEDKTE